MDASQERSSSTHAGFSNIGLLPPATFRKKARSIRRLACVGSGVFAFATAAAGAQFSATFLPGSSATWPAGTYFPGYDSRIYTSQTANPAGLFTNLSCMFRGWNSGGSSESLAGVALAYRFRLDFDQEVILQSFREVGCSWQQGAFLRVLNTNQVVLSSNALSVAVNLNVTNLVSLKLRGRSFIIEEFDPASQWRYRESFLVSYTPVSAVPITIQVASVAISWPSETNRVYQVEYASILAPNTWLSLGSSITGDGTTKIVFDDTLERERRFYRVVRIQ